MTPPGDSAKAANGKHLDVRYENGVPFHRRAVSEQTPLLAAATHSPFSRRRANSPDETLQDDELAEQEIQPNDFDRMLSRATSYTSRLGIEAESQESPMLRGKRTYSHRGNRRVSSVSALRRSPVSPVGLEEEAVIEEDTEESSESPYLGGISVSRFWLIYVGLLSNLVIPHVLKFSTFALIQWVVCCTFDMTILASSHPLSRVISILQTALHGCQLPSSLRPPPSSLFSGEYRILWAGSHHIFLH